MALGAMASYPDVNVKIVPVGLSYFHAHRFRSRAVIEFGPPLDIPSELVKRFQNGGPDKREAVSKLMDQVSDALKAVTVRAPDYDTLMVRNNVSGLLPVRVDSSAAHPSRATTLSTPRTTSYPRPGCRTEQAFPTCVQPLQG
jgi:hypothetical protein